MEWKDSKQELPEENKYVLIWYNDQPRKVFWDGYIWWCMDKNRRTPIRGTYWAEINLPNQN